MTSLEIATKRLQLLMLPTASLRHVDGWCAVDFQRSDSRRGGEFAGSGSST